MNRHIFRPGVRPEKGFEMTKEELMKTAEISEEAAEKILELFENERAVYEKKLAEMEREAEISELLRDNGARNVKAARALIEIKEGENVRESVLRQIAQLKRSEATKFLFETKRNGYYPAYSSEKLPGDEMDELEEELLEARKKNDTLKAIRIKHRAAEKGYSLL